MAKRRTIITATVIFILVSASKALAADIDLCVMPIYMDVGPYGIGYCYYDCEDIEVRANFPGILAVRIDEVYQESADWNIYWQDDINQFDGSGNWEKLSFCIDAKPKTILGDPGDKVLVGTATVSVKPPDDQGGGGHYVQLKECHEREVNLTAVDCGFIDLCAMPIYMDVGAYGNGIGYCYCDCEDIEVRANFPGILAVRIDEVSEEFADWNIYWQDGISQFDGGGDWEKLSLCIDATPKAILGDLGDRVLVGTATVSVKPHNDEGWGGQSGGIGKFVQVKECHKREVNLTPVDCGFIDLCAMPIYMDVGPYGNGIGYCHCDCEDIEVRANFSGILAVRINEVYEESADWNIYWQDGINQFDGSGDWEKLSLCIDATPKTILGDLGDTVLVGTATVSVKPHNGDGWGGGGHYVQLKDCYKTEVNLTPVDCGFINMEIDIYPNRTPNRVFLSRNYTLYVSVLGSATFDVSTLNSSTVKFGKTGTEASPVRAPLLRDMNGDGFIDAMYGFRTFDCGFAVGDAAGILTGKLNDGTDAVGSDSVLVLQ